MTVDHAHLMAHTGPPPHAYGDNLVLHSHPYALSLLARLGSPQTRQPEVGALCARAFEYLFTQIASIELPTTVRRVPTRMTAIHPNHAYEGVVLIPDTRIVVVDVARAGNEPISGPRSIWGQRSAWRSRRSIAVRRTMSPDRRRR